MGTRKSNRARLSIDVTPALRRRIRIVASARELSITDYVVDAVKERLKNDLEELGGEKGLLAMTARSDPVLAELWDNDKDAEYDRL
ncbi:MAG TPA: hypothetical protein VIH17_03900 [Candidatus Acidoferrales bacterium]